MSDPIRPRGSKQEALEAMSERNRSRQSERGFALVLAILALMLLTFLGLTLATTTSTELTIATNYRWSQQARYNAEAGLEVAKSMLRTLDWPTLLPDVRGGLLAPTNWDGATAPAIEGGVAGVAKTSRDDNWGNPTRNFENWQCDRRGNGMGYGVILDDPGSAIGPASGPVQYRTQYLGRDLNGAFTVWIRRPVAPRADGRFQDYQADADTMVVVAEGIAPFTGGTFQAGTAASAFGQANAAVQVVEAVVSRQVALGSDPCGGRGGQAGGGSEGSGFSPCTPVTGGGVLPGLVAAGAQNSGGGGDTGAK
jgi:Tfp pilus assembly protein PilX